MALSKPGLLLATVLAAACGSNEIDYVDSPDASTGGAAGGSAGTSGSGGTAGTSGSGGTAGTSGSGGTAGTSGSGGTAGTSGGGGTAGTSGSGGTAGTSGSGGTAGTAGTSGSGGMGGMGAVGATGGTGGIAGGPTSCVSTTVDPPQNAVACGTSICTGSNWCCGSCASPKCASVCDSADEIRVKCDAPGDCALGEDCCARFSGGKLIQTCRAKAECAGLGGFAVCNGASAACAKGSCQPSPYLGYAYCQ